MLGCVGEARRRHRLKLGWLCAIAKRSVGIAVWGMLGCERLKLGL
jgi:hypothetical protein